MMAAPVFFSVGEDTYRLRFPGMLGDFDGATLAGLPGGRFDSDERDYLVRGYGSAKYDIRVSEFGADLQPARIEAWFTLGDKPADIPQALKDSIVSRNEAASRGRTLVYVNGRSV